MIYRVVECDCCGVGCSDEMINVLLMYHYQEPLDKVFALYGWKHDGGYDFCPGCSWEDYMKKVDREFENRKAKEEE